MSDNRIRVDEGLLDKARVRAKVDGYSSLSDLINHILRLYVEKKIRLRLVVVPELIEGEQEEVGPPLPVFPSALAVRYEERRDVDGFKERVAVEATTPAKVEAEDSIDCSFFDGEGLGPMVPREKAEELREVLKMETELFKDPEHQPKVKWLDQRGDRWDNEGKELTRLGERREG